MSAPPNRTDLAGTPTVATYKIAIGLLYDYVAGLLGNGTATIATSAEQVKAREYLGVGATGFKNKLINPEFKIDQENAGAVVSIPVSASVKFVVDQWYALSTGATITSQQIAGISNREFSLRFTGATSNTGFTLGQRIESGNCVEFKNQTVTVSLKSKASNARTVTWTASYATVKDNFSSVTQIATGTFNLTTSTSDFSFSFNAGANAGNGLLITFANTALLASETVDFDQIQFENSSVPTEFQSRPEQQELALCQRYWELIDVSIQTYGASSNTVSQTIGWKSSKRSAPTLTASLTGANSSSRSANALGVTSINVTFVITSAGQSTAVGTVVGNARL